MPSISERFSAESIYNRDKRVIIVSRSSTMIVFTIRLAHQAFNFLLTVSHHVGDLLTDRPTNGVIAQMATAALCNGQEMAIHHIHFGPIWGDAIVKATPAHYQHVGRRQRKRQLITRKFAKACQKKLRIDDKCSISTKKYAIELIHLTKKCNFLRRNSSKVSIDALIRHEPGESKLSLMHRKTKSALFIAQYMVYRKKQTKQK